MPKPPLTVEQILSWADAHHARSGEWPRHTSGPVAGAPGETWLAVQMALVQGHRGLPGGTTLVRLLEQSGRRPAPRRGLGRVPLTPDLILSWADRHRRRTGQWPTAVSGAVTDAPRETWAALDQALRVGRRGLPGNDSLARLLERERGHTFKRPGVRLTERKVLAWARAHFRRHGRWPVCASGVVEGAGGENWHAIDMALRYGYRGLPGGSSLAKLLREHAGP